MVTASPVRPRARFASPERWQAALVRAFAEGVQVRQLATSGVWVATSGTHPDVAYVVTGAGCECPAAANGDAVCKHRAMYWHLHGCLDAPADPEPVPVIPSSVVRIVRVDPADETGDLVGSRCPHCQGTGRDNACQGHAVEGALIVCECDACGGDGWIPAVTEDPTACLAAD